jgi:anaerobic magnesium-protoporphyrin IX monomethyl ester cyclase
MRNFDCATESKGNYLYQPYDFLLMTGKIPSAWPVQFLDAIASELNSEQLLADLNVFKPDIIVCAVAATNWQQDLNFVKLLREQFPTSYLLVFGDLFVNDPPVKEIEASVNGIFTSPVMFEFSTFANLKEVKDFIPDQYTGFRNPDFYQRSDLKNPTEITLKDLRHDLFVHPNYRWPFARSFQYTTIFTAWGCPYSCSYCILNKFPNYWRNFNEIISEMEIVKNSGIKEIYIGDRSFGLPLNNVVQLLNRMVEKEFNFSWSTYFHPNQYNPELLDLMKKSGCHTLIIGVESRDFKSLKKFGRHVREKNFEDLIKHAKKIGINICGDFIIGLPGETKKDIESTIQFSLELDLAYASYNIAAPLAGSVIREMAIQNGQIKDDEQEIDSFGRSRIISVCNENDETLRKLRDQAIVKFYLRPNYLFKRLIDLKSFEHFFIQFQEALLMFSKLLVFK